MNDLDDKLNIKVLMYHRVLKKEPLDDAHWHYVTASAFRKHLKMIDWMGYTPVTFYDYKLYKEGKLTLPAKPIIITFDDGYLDTYENAIPILLEMDMRAVIFVMGNRNLQRAYWDERNEGDMCPLMSDEQVRHVSEMGFEVGAHSMNHTTFLKLSSVEISHQLEKSKDQIESILNDEIYTFAYPYGGVDDRVRDVVSESEFSFACGVYTGSPKFGKTVFDIRRLAVNQKTALWKFALLLLLPYQYVEWIYHRVKSRQDPQMLEKDLYVNMEDGRNRKLKKSKNGKPKETDMIIHNISNRNSR